MRQLMIQESYYAGIFKIFSFINLKVSKKLVLPDHYIFSRSEIQVL